MIKVICLLCSVVSLSTAVPLYGQDGGYSGYASYLPLKNHLQDSTSRGIQQSDDSFHASAGSPEISKRPAKEVAPSPHNGDNAPESYEALRYKPSYQPGYESNDVEPEVEEKSYAKENLYGQRNGGYKIADVYQKQPIELDYDKKDYKDDYISYPQPYEYGYALKDEHGNTQHRMETSDGEGKVRGSYGFTDEHGIYRSVQYVADKEGFRASVKTNEPGTDNQNPADVHIESEQAKYP